LSLCLLGPVVGIARAATEGGSEEKGSGQKAQVANLTDKVGDLSSELESAEQSFDRIILPVSLLISILAAGGILGVVFSFRDQQRTSQLHELTVGGEIASQKRSEQSYGSFLEQSQTTLSLVNDTLQLAKEANDRAMQSMEDKAKSRIAEIEERSQTLLLDVFAEEEFELIINDGLRRDELHDTATELRSLEGYLSLQDIELPQYTKFVKALDQFLLDDTEAAIHALRLASQEGAVGELQRFIEYWLGYMLTTVGDYDEAIRKFRHDEGKLKEDDVMEFLQLERIIAETEFFLVAKVNAQREASTKHGQETTSPPERFKLVAPLLDELTELAEKLERSADHHARHNTRLEIARTRADIYEWVAYDPAHLDDPIDSDEILAADAVLSRHPDAEAGTTAVDFLASSAWAELQRPDLFRTWSLRRARRICEEVGERNLDLEFALAECLFKLHEDKAADTAFESAERALHRESAQFHEKRRSATIHQSVLICHSRLLKLREKDPNQKRDLDRQILTASRETLDVVKSMRQGRTTIFSQIQRRNVSQTEFRAEVDEIVNQDGIEGNPS
jgi:tetratricopeptide (TPR) repeat protein